jgi:hypothetical protein
MHPPCRALQCGLRRLLHEQLAIEFCMHAARRSIDDRAMQLNLSVPTSVAVHASASYPSQQLEQQLAQTETGHNYVCGKCPTVFRQSQRVCFILAESGACLLRQRCARSPRGEQDLASPHLPAGVSVAKLHPCLAVQEASLRAADKLQQQQKQQEDRYMYVYHQRTSSCFNSEQQAADHSKEEVEVEAYNTDVSRTKISIYLSISISRRAFAYVKQLNQTKPILVQQHEL